MYQSPIEEKVKTLIEKYLEKIQVMEDSITVIKEMIDAMKGDTNSDIEDLRKEMAIANTDIRMYSKFIKDLENLIDTPRRNPKSQ